MGADKNIKTLFTCLFETIICRWKKKKNFKQKRTLLEKRVKITLFYFFSFFEYRTHVNRTFDFFFCLWWFYNIFFLIFLCLERDFSFNLNPHSRVHKRCVNLSIKTSLPIVRMKKERSKSIRLSKFNCCIWFQSFAMVTFLLFTILPNNTRVYSILLNGHCERSTFFLSMFLGIPVHFQL